MRLLVKAFQKTWIVFKGPNHLYCDRAVQRGVCSLKHYPHAPSADDLEYRILADLRDVSRGHIP
jgi:hypothetical protein